MSIEQGIMRQFDSAGYEKEYGSSSAGPSSTYYIEEQNTG